MAKLIKYMGVADVKTLKKGEDFDGRLQSGLPADLVFDAKNRWVVDVEAAGLDEAQLEALLEGDDFKDVSDLDRIPSNLNQQTYRGHAKTEGAQEALRGIVALGNEGKTGNESDDDQNPQGASDTGATTTVGGSTPGARGGRRGAGT